MAEEHYDTPWEYKNRFMSALRPRPHSSNVALPTCSTSNVNASPSMQHKSMLLAHHPEDAKTPTPSPPTGKVLKKSIAILPSPSTSSSSSTEQQHHSRRSRVPAGNDYPFVKHGNSSERKSLSSGLLKKFSRFDEGELIHENVDRALAEQLLAPRPVGEFLLRRREDGNLALSLRATEAVLHIKLEKRGSSAWVLGEGPQFPSIAGCLKYYYRTALPIRGSEHVILRAALPKSTLPVH